METKEASTMKINCKNAVITAERMDDVVTQILHRIDMMESHEGKGSTAERWSTTTSCNGTVQGPLTTQEIAELSYLCHAVSTTNTSASSNTRKISNGKSNDAMTMPETAVSMMNDTNANDRLDFSNMESDSLLSLMELLDRHVNVAVAIHLLEHAAAVVLAHAAHAPSQVATVIDQVRRA
jgi:hypothetical protein